MTDFKPNWTLNLIDQIAVALSIALHKNVPEWPGCTDEQMEAVVRDVLEMMGR